MIFCNVVDNKYETSWINTTTTKYSYKRKADAAFASFLWLTTLAYGKEKKQRERKEEAFQK